MTAAALDEGRSGNLQRHSALLHHIYAVLQSAAQESGPRDAVGLAHFGHSGSRRARPRTLGPAEQSAVVAYHKERMALEAARKSMGAPS